MIDQPLSDHMVMTIFNRLGLEPASYHEFMQCFNSPSISTQANMPHNLASLLSIFTQCTWFQLSGTSVPVAYSSGSGAGSPLADVIFVFAISTILRKCRSTLVHEGIVTPIATEVEPSLLLPCGSEMDIHGYESSYIDDCVFFISRKHPAQLVEASLAMVCIVADTFLTHALTPNFSSGKSEIILSLRGKGACLLYTSPSPRDRQKSRMPSSA